MPGCTTGTCGVCYLDAEDPRAPLFCSPTLLSFANVRLMDDPPPTAECEFQWKYGTLDIDITLFSNGTWTADGQPQPGTWKHAEQMMNKVICPGDGAEAHFKGAGEASAETNGKVCNENDQQVGTWCEVQGG